MGRRNTNLAPAHVIGLGCGGIEELRQRLSDSSVAWGLLRFEVGDGAFATEKFVAVHVNSENVAIVRRGRMNARTPEMLSQFGTVHATIEVNSAEELSFETVLQKLAPSFADDALPSVSVTVLKKAYEQRILQQKRNSRRSGLGMQMMTLRERLQLSGGHVDSRRANALTAVSGKGGRYNWILLQSPNLELFDAGCGGLPEMTRWLHDDKVLFGIIRFTFAQTVSRVPATVKHIFVRSIGAQVSPVIRGQLTAKWADAELILKSECSASLVKECDCADALDLGEIVAELKRLCEIDSEHSERMQISVSQYLATLEEETALALDEQYEAESIEQAMPDIATAVQALRAKAPSCNWILLTLQQQEQGHTAQSRVILDEPEAEQNSCSAEEGFKASDDAAQRVQEALSADSMQ